MASSLGSRLSRDDFKKSKELEELRKTGAAPPEVDEDGKMINPHIPQYISERPWYLLESRPGLKHQRTSMFADKEQLADMSTWYHRGQVKESKEGKFRKGACENCGSMTHKVKECTERPRKVGAKFSNTDIRGDERIDEIKLDFDGKRDRWNGYNPAEYVKVIRQYERAEEERTKQKAKELDAAYKQKKVAKAERKLRRKQEKKDAKQKKREEAKAARLAAGGAPSDEDASGSSDTDASDTDTDNEGLESDSDEEFKDSGRIIQSRKANEKFTTNQTTARDLRIREDTAKYLRNLNVHSAYYDPKTRSMRENPTPHIDPSQLMYAGDNFVRKSGEVLEQQRVQSFVWEANDRGNDEINALANPSQAEFLHKQYKEKRAQLVASKKSDILDKYGGAEHLDAPDRSLLMAESEGYVEYADNGEVIKGLEKAIPKTKYLEDVYESNHKSVWGSWWKDGKWGYACCHQVIRAAYCTGDILKASAPGRKTVPAPAAAAAIEAPPAASSSSGGAAAFKRTRGDEDEDGSSSSDSSDGDSRTEQRRKRRMKAAQQKADTPTSKSSPPKKAASDSDSGSSSD